MSLKSLSGERVLQYHILFVTHAFIFLKKKNKQVFGCRFVLLQRKAVEGLLTSYLKGLADPHFPLLCGLIINNLCRQLALPW